MNANFKCVRFIRLLLIVLCFNCVYAVAASTTNPPAVTALLDRIGGTGASNRFITILDEALSDNGKDVFVLSSQDGKPCIKGSSVLAISTGINWYLNHVAHINLAWNNLTTDLTTATLPLPSGEERRTCSADYRYYLNYCTFSYSMSTWTWERWQQEIDWMALHGINMPLQIVGLDVVWKKLLTEDLGYTSAEANDFIAGPCFQAWWGMNNLEGWGGPNPDWWYTRQEELAQKILQRERELGMQPVLPGYAGMVPSDIASKGYTANNQGNWCNFVRPYILDPNSAAFSEISAKYYKRLEEVMGTSEYYSMDPFHEGANTDGIDVPSAYKKIGEAMTKANADGKWVIQYWQWSYAQYNVLSQVEKGKLIVLDLFSDAHTHFGEYQGHDAVYCALPNFGGRTGLFGRLSKIITEYFAEKSQHSNIKGIGATPEAIEQVPVLYDALFELPWYTSAPNPQAWLADYSVSRYGVQNANAQAAWEKIRNSALNCETSLQGPQEAVLCARPALSVGAVSSWGGTDIFYNAQDVVDAAYQLLQARGSLSGENYSYDLTDFSRQALTDYGYYLLKSLNAAVTAGDNTAYATRRDAYLQLILDLDELLNTNKNFMLGRWTNMARGIADEVSGTSNTDKNWLELDNARTLITTWGARDQSEGGGLRDYSYREWGGMMKDFYYARWKAFFDNRDKGTTLPDWYTNDHAWAQNSQLSYSDQPVGATAEVAQELFDKYFIRLTTAEGTPYYIYRFMANEAGNAFADKAVRGESYTLPLADAAQGGTATLGIDFNNDGVISTGETVQGITAAVPTTALTGRVLARVTWTDGTTFDFRLTLKDDISTPRTVSVATADASQGSVSIEGSDELSVTNTDEVTLLASPVTGYDFLNWTNAEGVVVSTDNPFTYFGAEAAAFTANFIVNKWGSPAENLSDYNDMNSYGQYVRTMTVAQNGGEEQSIYEVSQCPETLCQTTQIVHAPQGSQIRLHWQDAGGLNYCRLSAYADFNCDGDFDDEGEFLTVVGGKSTAGNSQLNDYSFDILFPYDVPEGITHIRLRFDSSWSSGWDSQTDAMPAKAETRRMVYDVPVNITTQAATACTVTVKSADTAKGTVDANGQPDTYTYAVGEEVVLRAYPAAGFAVNNWTDQYGRVVPESWVDGNFLRFHAPESGTYTANFAPALPSELTLGNWTFQYTTEGDDITLTKALSGEGELIVPVTYAERAIVGIAPEALQGQTALTALSLPASVVSLAPTSLVFSTSFEGAGVQDAPIALDQPLANDKAWRVNVEVTNGGNSFNQWGSALLATGSEALGNSYDNGFQLYLKTDGSIVLKLGWEEKKTFTAAQGAGTFSAAIEHTADGSLTVSITNGNNTESYTENDYALNDITQFCTALASGTNLTDLRVIDPAAAVAPFRGCSRLAELTVAQGNPAYQAIDNVLYSADGTTLLAYPEGRIAHTLTLPRRVVTINSHAFTSAKELDRIVVQTATPATAMDEAFETNTFFVQSSPAQATSYRAAWGLPILLNAAETAELTAEETAQLTENDALNIEAGTSQSGTALSLNERTALWLTTTLRAGELRPIYFPTAPTRLTVEGLSVEETPVEALQYFAYDEGIFTTPLTLTAGAYLVGLPAEWGDRTVTLHFEHAGQAALTQPGFGGNGTAEKLLAGAQTYAYDAADNAFHLQPLSDNDYVYPFAAVMLAGEGAPSVIEGPRAVGIGNATVNGDGQASEVYDVQGRYRQTNSTRQLEQGVYIQGGQKVIVR